MRAEKRNLCFEKMENDTDSQIIAATESWYAWMNWALLI
jgi:hypothetical protein